MSKFNIGVQLYSVRDEFNADPRACLHDLKEMGFDTVEFAGYANKTAEELRGYLDEFGLKCVSVHQNYPWILESGQKAVDYIKTLGAKYVALPWTGPEMQKGTENFDGLVKDIVTTGELLKANDMYLLYHNHDFEFKTFEGKYVLDWLYETVPADLLGTQIDTCWVHYAGVDPCAYILKYQGRAPIVHLKDFDCKNLAAGPVYNLIDDEGNPMDVSNGDKGFEYRPLGMGRQNVPALIEAAEKAGTHTLIVEQDESPDRPRMESVRISREYLKSIGF